jgi:pyrophosphatase PpaX
MKTYSAYLFDADGTLIDTVELIYQCFVHTCGMFANRKVSREEVIGQIGLPLKRNFEFFLGNLSPEKLEQARIEHMRYQLEIYRDYLAIFPDVKEALVVLKARRKKLGVVTSRMMETLKLYLDTFGIFNLFDVCITPPDTEKHKPEPEPVQEALRRIGLKPNEALVVGDAEFDIESGSRAGTDTAFVSWSHTPVESLAIEPTYVISSLKELL